MVDRVIVQGGAQVQDTDILNLERGFVKGVGSLAQLVIGSATAVAGLACTATSPASMSVNVAPGALFIQGVVDATAYGSLAPDSTLTTKVGAIDATTTFALTAPTTVGQSVNYLIQVAYSEFDTAPAPVKFYNSANPSQPTTATLNTIRKSTAVVTLVSGTPATTGSQVTPSATTGSFGLYVVQVDYGMTSITQASISKAPGYPGSPDLLNKVAKNYAWFGTPGTYTFTVPLGISAVEATVQGGGGGGGGGNKDTSGNHFDGAGGGGGGGGYAVGVIPNLTGNANITITVGGAGIFGPLVAGGYSSVYTGNTVTNSGTSGGASSFGTYVSATGGSFGFGSQAKTSGQGGDPGQGFLGSGIQGRVSTGDCGDNGYVVTGAQGGRGGRGGSAGSGGNGGRGSDGYYFDGVSEPLVTVKDAGPGGGGGGGGPGHSGSYGGPGWVLVRW